MLAPGILTLPRRLIPAVMLLAAGGSQPPRAAITELERTGVAIDGSLSPEARRLVAVMTDPDLVISVDVTTHDGTGLSTIWATADHAVWGRPVADDTYQLRATDAVAVPLLLAQLTGVGRRPEAPFSGSVAISREALAAALDWQPEDPETALGILVAAGVDATWADRILIAHQHQRSRWTVSSVWTDGGRGHEVNEATVLDAGPAGYWRITSPEPDSVVYTVASVHETMRVLRRCVPGRPAVNAPDPG